MIESMKNFAAGALAACALCLAAAPGIAWAAAAPAVSLAQEEAGSVSVGVSAPGDVDDVRALKLTLAVRGAEGSDVSVDFAFDDAGGVDVREARSSEADGEQRISLYLASKDKNLLTGEDQTLGTLRLTSEDASTVEVSVVGFEAVNAAHDALGEQDLGIELPEATRVQTSAERGVSPMPPDGEGEAPQPEERPEGGDGSGSGADSPNTSPGAPAGAVSPLVSTGDGLLPFAAVFAAFAFLSGLAAFASLRGSRSTR